MRLGLSTYSYTWAIGVPGQMPGNPMSAFELIDEADRLGVSCVQIADNLPLHLMTGADLKKLSACAVSKGISIEAGTRGLLPENLLKYIEIADELGSPILRIVIDAQGFEPSLAEVTGIINKYIPVLKNNKIRLAIENHDRLRSSEFAEIVLRTDPEWVGICLDSVNSMGAAEGLHEVVETLAPFTINLHLKDFTVKRVWHKMGFVVEGVPAGNGMLQIDWLKDLIERKGHCQSAILELWTPPESDLDSTRAKEKLWVEESIRNLKPKFK
jgi:3-oxoisoapionate decarboxylase